MSTPGVSIHMLAYNHEPYIGEAIESIMMQRTSFPFELVIGEDRSKDRTRAIIQEYCDRYPGRIRLLPDAGKNLGMMGNMVRTFAACDGTYVAMCEGDDYWIDPYKLQKQYDFMEANPDCSLCFHAIEHRYPDASMNFVQQNYPCDTWVDLRTIILNDGAFIGTASIFFRGEFGASLPDWVGGGVVGDYPLTIYLAMNGRVRFMKDVMSVYRRMSVGSWSTGWSWWRHKALTFGNNRMLIAANKDTEGRHFRLLATKMIQSNWGLFKAMLFAMARPAYRMLRPVKNG